MFQQKDNVSDNSICNAKAINHVCLAVKNIEASIALYSKMFGVATPKIQIMLDQKVKAAMVNVGNTNLEFIEPIDGEGGVAKFINNKGEGIHHICFEVENIESSIEQLKKAKVKLIDSQPRQGLDGMIAFIHPKATGNVLIELVETPSSDIKG